MRMVRKHVVLALVLFANAFARAAPIAPPPTGKYYPGFYFSGIGTDTHDPTEHDVAPPDLARYESTVGAKTAWSYLSDYWFESRTCPEAACRWVRELGKVPYLRQMFPSDADQQHA